MDYTECRPGRNFMGRLPHGKDLIQSITSFCGHEQIHTATFSLIGAVLSVTLGAYDQKQQVYVSDQKTAPLEIVACAGNISLKDGEPFVHAHAVLAEEDGTTLGGHIFSETIVFAGEIQLQEWHGAPLERVYDPQTGLMLWETAPLSTVD